MAILKTVNDRPYAYLLLAFFVFSVISTGISISDLDQYKVFRVYLGEFSVSAIPWDRQFLIEGLLPNTFGALLVKLGIQKILVELIWLLVPILGIVSAFLFALRSGALNLSSIFFIVIYSSALKMFLFWFGKADPYLMFCLINMSIFKLNRPAMLSVGLLSALCHPQITLFAALGLASMSYVLNRSVRYDLMIGCIAGLILQHFLLLHLFPGYSSRSDYIARQLSDMVFLGAVDFINFAIVALLVPNLILVLSDIYKLSDLTKLKVMDAIAIILTFGVPFVVSCLMTYDHSRVFVLSTLPATILIIVHFGPKIRAFFETQMAVAATLALVIAAIPQFDGNGWHAVAPDHATRVAKILDLQSTKEKLLCRSACSHMPQSPSQ